MAQCVRRCSPLAPESTAQHTYLSSRPTKHRGPASMAGGVSYLLLCTTTGGFARELGKGHCINDNMLICIHHQPLVTSTSLVSAILSSPAAADLHRQLAESPSMRVAFQGTVLASAEAIACTAQKACRGYHRTIHCRLRGCPTGCRLFRTLPGAQSIQNFLTPSQSSIFAKSEVPAPR